MSLQIHSFTFNPFSENTYVLYDESGECVIIDPGCYHPEEKKELSDFIAEKKLKAVRLLNTHGHIDHVMGNKYVHDTFGLFPEIHVLDIPLLTSAPATGLKWGIPTEPSPEPSVFLKEDELVTFGNTKLSVLFTPGHSPGSICFLCEKEKIIISGDVLFEGSIGRTDLPGGNYEVLMQSIHEKLLKLDDDIRVFPGHGASTTIGMERKGNPFLQ